MTARVPLLVLTGFLGAGKTTVLNRLLERRRTAAPIGVVVNELGEIGIDGALLGGDSPRQIELPGGCVCCVLGDELDETLVSLVTGRELSAVVLETTGVAEPLPIAWAVAKPGSRVAERVRLAAVVTLVDAENFLASRAVSAAVDAQVAYADLVLITKSGPVEQVEAAVRELAPRAQIRRGTTAEHAAVLDELLAEPSLDPTASPFGDAATAGHARTGGRETIPQPPAHGAPGHVHTDACRHADTSAHGIDSVGIEIPDELDIEELEDQLAALPHQYVRIKGIARGVDARSGTPVRGWFAFHRVGLRASSEPVAEPRWATGRAVALGPGVEQSALAAAIAAATA